MVLDAVAAAGLHPARRLLGLNSYENRVYQVGLDEGQASSQVLPAGPLGDAQIDEEHAFARELAER